MGGERTFDKKIPTTWRQRDDIIELDPFDLEQLFPHSIRKPPRGGANRKQLPHLINTATTSNSAVGSSNRNASITRSTRRTVGAQKRSIFTPPQDGPASSAQTAVHTFWDSATSDEALSEDHPTHHNSCIPHRSKSRRYRKGFEQ